MESPRREEVEDGMVLRPNISNRYNPTSFRSVYEEFHGIGEYDGVPIVGGLAEMDRRYKRKWRSGDILDTRGRFRDCNRFARQWRSK